MLIYAAIEDAIIARIQAASDGNALGYRLAQIGSYGGEFDDETFFTQFRKFPAVWVTVGGSKPKRVGSHSWLLAPTIAVMVGTRNVRGERQTRHGTVNEPGSYQILEDVRNLLVGQTLGLALAPLAVGNDRTLFNTRQGAEARSVLAAEFLTSFTYQPPAPDAVAEDLNLIGLNYYLRPGDEIADAVDTVTLAA